MKASFLAVALLGLLLSGTPDLRAQVYGPYYDPYWDLQYQQYLQYQHYLQWQDYLEYLRQTDPYYDLHVLHYQLYLRPYQPYQIYQPCCFTFGVPTWSSSLGRDPIGVEVPHKRLGVDEISRNSRLQYKPGNEIWSGFLGGRDAKDVLGAN